MINFYHRFIPHCAQVLQPLHTLLTRTHAKSELQWSECCVSAFNAAKEALAQATLLFHPTPDAPTAIMTDASDIAVGAQFINNQWQPISNFSRKLSHTERRYSTFDRELLAVYLAIKHFHHFVEGRVFSVYTDHKPLTFSLHTKSDTHSPRQLRHLDFIAQFTSDIRHIQGRQNPVADALSRVELNAVDSVSPPVVDFEAMAAAQDNCRYLSDESPHHSLTLHPIPLPNSTNSIICDISHGIPRPVVPPSFRKVVFDALHSLSHPGIKATQKLISQRFVWPKMYSLIKRWARLCLPCQRSKVVRHTLSPVASFPAPDARFDHIHIDIVGPLLRSHGQTYLLTCIDRFTCWPEAFPLTDITAPSVARSLVSGWIARFGVPSTITTDRGGQFESSLWAQLIAILGTTRCRTTSYHPQSNGLVERFHRQLKGALKAQLDVRSWTESLPMVLLGIRTALKDDLHCTAAELVYGVSLRLPGEFFSPSSLTLLPEDGYITRLKQFMSTLRATPPRPPNNQPSFVADALASASYVFIRRDSSRSRYNCLMMVHSVLFLVLTNILSLTLMADKIL